MEQAHDSNATEAPPAAPAGVPLRVAPPLVVAPRRLWAAVLHQLTSVRLAILLLIALGGTAALGTIFPDLDVYHSRPFAALLVALALNIAVCSTRRLGSLVRSARQVREPLDDAVHSHAALRTQIRLDGTPEQAAGRVREALGARGLAVVSAARGGKIYLLGEGGRLAPYGPVVTHLSFLLILAGALASALWGYAGHAVVPEGATVEALELDDGRKVPFGFGVRCDDFTVDYYPGSEQPSDFRSDLVVLDGGREVLRKTIRVNDPLTWGGLRFYQSSYGELPPAPGSGTLHLEVAGTGGAPRAVEAPIGVPVPLEGSQTLLVRHFTGNFRMNGGGPQGDDGSLENPAALIAVLDGPRVVQEGWRFVRYPGFAHGKPGPWRIELTGLHGTQYTGLRVSHDPGVGLVYAGGILLSVGLMLSFFQRQRRYWARLEPVQTHSLLSLAARTQRHAAALEPEFADLVESLRPAGFAPEPAARPSAPAAKPKRKRRS